MNLEARVQEALSSLIIDLCNIRDDDEAEQYSDDEIRNEIYGVFGYEIAARYTEWTT